MVSDLLKDGIAYLTLEEDFTTEGTEFTERNGTGREATGNRERTG